MHQRAFQTLKRTLKLVSGLPLPYFDFVKTNLESIWFLLSKFGGGRPETCINVRYMP